MREIRWTYILCILAALVILPFKSAAQTPALESFNRGFAEAEKRYWHEALLYFREAHKADPDLLFLAQYLGVAASHVDGWELRGIAWLKTYLLIAPDTPERIAIEKEIARLELILKNRLTSLLDRFEQFIPAYQKEFQLAFQDVPSLAKPSPATYGIYLGAARYFLGDRIGAERVLRATNGSQWNQTLSGKVESNRPIALLQTSLLSAGLFAEASRLGFVFSREQLGLLLAKKEYQNVRLYLQSARPNSGWGNAADGWLMVACDARHRGEMERFEEALAQGKQAMSYLNFLLAFGLRDQASEYAKAEGFPLPDDIDDIEKAIGVAKQCNRDLWGSRGRLAYLVDLASSEVESPFKADKLDDTGLADDLRQIQIRLQSQNFDDVPIAFDEISYRLATIARAYRMVSRVSFSNERLNMDTGADSLLQTPSPGFDCSKATGPDEIAVCKSAKLARLDRQLSTLYESAQKRTQSRETLRRLIEQQRTWVKQRGSCQNNEKCLEAQYESRIAQLKNWR